MRRDSHDTIELVEAALTVLKGELVENDPLVHDIALESGLHRLSLSSTLAAWVETISAPAMKALVDSISRPTGGHVTTLAPGNVPVVAAEAIIVGLLAEVSHDLALSRRSSVLPHRMREILCSLDTAVAQTVRLHTWRELTESARRSLLGADRVVVYGSADTVEWVATHVSPHTVVIPHGPSVALAYLSTAGIDGKDVICRLRELALDVTSYDQRGCRSPHALLVVGDEATLREVVSSLVTQLGTVSKALPRGSLTAEEVNALYLDKLTSTSLGSVIEGPSWRITIEARAEVIRPSPLGRTLRIIGIESESALSATFATLPAPVGLLLTPDGATPNSLVAGFDGEILPFGGAQQPPFDRFHDGRHRLDELLALPD